MSDFDADRKERIEKLLLRYNTQSMPGRTLRDYLRQDVAVCALAATMLANLIALYGDSSASTDLSRAGLVLAGMRQISAL